MPELEIQIEHLGNNEIYTLYIIKNDLNERIFIEEIMDAIPPHFTLLELPNFSTFGRSIVIYRYLEEHETLIIRARFRVREGRTFTHTCILVYKLPNGAKRHDIRPVTFNLGSDEQEEEESTVTVGDFEHAARTRECLRKVFLEQKIREKFVNVRQPFTVEQKIFNNCEDKVFLTGISIPLNLFLLDSITLRSMKIGIDYEIIGDKVIFKEEIPLDSRESIILIFTLKPLSSGIFDIYSYAIFKIGSEVLSKNFQGDISIEVR